ncbi:alpha/beta hydrolase [Pseudomonas sp. TKO26]|uniref:alpha/beta hydrolase family protein n=1 Tax=unclassified Pseudomonas TaxID=196821 RepID=UPI000D9F9CCA|nr:MULTISPECIES: alpha/beta fold hydrolase [unclassified Pseudomonas]PYY89705.1 alpha/beta hydrolase [Pseudomonas sp. TKO30]PYY92792.1 alpha/beta hydrolase [Pseudomonas sp. TKO29]PYY95156.1 alpha/beta hydrolase [Pseudomonas sp. TKO26]PYZ01241.1 alpha/beta hydrolase [Pseudomonas sp. TKO14]
MSLLSPPDLPATRLAAARPGPSETFSEPAADGFVLGGFAWRHPQADPSRPVVIINAATSVRCRYYLRFADYLFANGFDVMTYDYRGIGESRPASLKGLKASWSDWGALDFEAMLQRARREFPGQPIDVVGHSFGGCAVGLAASAGAIRRVATMGAQFAYWCDYAPGLRWRMLGKWHVLMPLLTRLYGYFPGKRLGWMEDTPAGVVRDWATPHPRYEGRPSGRRLAAKRNGQPFTQVSAAVLAISLSDDPFGTVAAIERLLAYFSNSPRTHLRIAPQDIGETEIGHFAFFHSRFDTRLWPIILGWLRHGELDTSCPGRVVPRA